MRNVYWMNTSVMDERTEEQEMNAVEILDNLTDNVTNVKDELNRKLALARKYGYDEYADELVRLVEKLDMLRKGRA